MNLIEIKNDLASDRIKSVIIDSDTYNEEDDQFAIAYSMLAPDKMKLLAINAAPFHNLHSESYEDGMLKSYDEIIKITNLVDPNHSIPIFKGSRERMPDANTPVDSEAADNIIKTARAIDDTLYIIAIGAITNVASAIVKAPDIKDKLCVIWLAMHAADYPNGAQGDFNYWQDPTAGIALMESGVNIVLVPAEGGSKELLVSKYELEAILKGKNKFSDYLVDLVMERAPEDDVAWNKCIWDLAGPAVITTNSAMHIYVSAIPEFRDNLPIFTQSKNRPVMLMAGYLQRDAIFDDMYERMIKA